MVRFPFNLIIRPLGGLPIDTKNKTKGGNVDIMADLFRGNDEFAMGITPEGTRSLRTKWKSGFYHLAKDNNLPICFGYLDYRTKTAAFWDVLPTLSELTCKYCLEVLFKELLLPHHVPIPRIKK